MKYILEACVGNYREGKKAEELGADRIELCDNLLEGGTTPSYGTILLAKKNIKCDINVIIRPRGGNFIYSDEEFQIMKQDIQICKNIGVNGVVIGILNSKNKIDFNRTKELVDLCKPLSVTFHMAFDEIEDKKEAIEELISLGINRILTKGGTESAFHNIKTLKDLVEYAGKKIIILPGGGVNKYNYKKLAEEILAQEYHGSKIVGELI
ncbi:copper homeostasis protein CutC [Clostridium tarantellae]|uniref:PF03932 family protein CutC n=1 Tax=Clostridium tarantellae TaxID=39493 RepID=A0A6I1MP61_9CLOT|nr:copper homeostasis protein CutC [Clostridium tarantellae]MPQ42661.1 copper homeostasis protein CutC [Clostridium tarantellae]